MKKVTVLGVGPGNPDTMTIASKKALESADLLVGAARLLQSLPFACSTNRVEATRPEAVTSILRENTHWQNACVVMSGDVGLFSGSKKLLETLAEYEVDCIPGISSVQYLAAKLGRPWQGWRFVSAHGVACNVVREVSAGGEVFFVTGGEHTVGTLCQALCAAGMAHANVVAGERLSYEDERISTGSAADFAGKVFDSLSVMLVEHTPCEVWPYKGSGIPDELFIRGKAPMTKQEVRAAALAKLCIKNSDVVYDIGAGTGSVSVEAARLAKRGMVYSIEHKPEAAALINENAAKFGLHNVQVITGKAPDALSGLPTPDAVFIGGSGGELAGILAVLKTQNPRLRVCVACITLETLNAATQLMAGDGYETFEVCQISVSRTRSVAGYHMMEAQNSIFLVSAWGVEA